MFFEVGAESYVQRGQGAGRGGDFDFFSAMTFLQALDEDGNGELSSSELENATVALRTLDKNIDVKFTDDKVRPTGGDPPLILFLAC